MVLGAGGLGGFELSVAQLGLFLEADASLALLKVSSQRFECGPVLIPILKLSFGLNSHF